MRPVMKREPPQVEEGVRRAILLVVPANHRFGEPRIRFKKLKSWWCRRFGHKPDFHGPILRCRRCGDRATGKLLTNPLRLG